MLFKDKLRFEDALKRGASLDLFKDDTEVRIFMDLAMDVLPMPSPVRAGQVKVTADYALTDPLNHLKDALELREKIDGGFVEGVLGKYRTAMARAAYVVTQQLHVLQLRMLEALKSELDKDSNKNKSVSALLDPSESQTVQEIVHVGSDDEVPLEAGDL